LASHSYGFGEFNDITNSDNEKPAVILLHQIRKIYDGTLFVAIKLKENPLCKTKNICPFVGVVFRYVDVFNHYGVSIFNGLFTF